MGLIVGQHLLAQAYRLTEIEEPTEACDMLLNDGPFRRIQNQVRGQRRHLAVVSHLIGLQRVLYRVAPLWVEYDQAKKRFVKPPQLPAAGSRRPAA